MKKINIDKDVEQLLSGNSVFRSDARGAYDAASHFDNTIALWTPPLNSADGDIIPEKTTLDLRARDSIRNDAYIAGGSSIHKDNIVGSMFLLNAKPNLTVLGLSEEWEQAFQEEVEAKFTLWAESPDNWVDAARINSFTSMIRLAVGVYTMAGEVLATVEWLRDEGIRRPFNTAIQMVDLDRLSNPHNEPNDSSLRGGVLRNSYGAPQGYYIRMAHPTDFTDANSWRWKFVPIRKPWGRLQVLHIFEQTRPDQSRGISDLVTILKELKITKKFRDVVLQNAVVNATYAAAIESELPSDAVYAALGGGNIKASDSISQYAQQYMGAIKKYVGNARHMKIDGVRIPHLFPGTKLHMQPAGQAGPLGTEFEQSLLRYLAAGLGVSYEQLSRDYTNTNYSSARAAMLETWKFMQSRKKLVADRFATHVYRLWFEEALNKGQLETMKGVPNFYEGLNAEAYTACEWIGASRGQIDELKETQAAVLRLKYNLTTHEDELARLGKDWRKVFAQKERENTEMEKRNLILEEETNTMNAIDGSPAEPGQNRASEGDEVDGE